MDNTNAIDEMSEAVRHLKTAQAMASDARRALIRADRKLGANSLSENLSGHIKQTESLIKEHGNCAMFIEATLALLRGNDSNIEIVEG
jgi:hypothetical protein